MATPKPAPNTPVLIGAGQFVHRGDVSECPPSQGLLERAATQAALDAGLSISSLTELDSVSVVGFTIDAPGPIKDLPFPRLRNAPKTLADALKARPRTLEYTHMGGNTPQALVNAIAERIAERDTEFALIAGAEFLGALRKLMMSGHDLSAWTDPDAEAEAPSVFGDPRDGCSLQEAAHGLALPVNTYPLFQNALRAHLGESLSDHQVRLGRLFAPFTSIAKENPYAWLPKERTAAEIANVTDANRYVGWPYTKYMNAIMDVNQSAAVLLCSVEKAQALGVPEEKRVYLHGCADAAELWNPLDRVNYYTSPAISVAAAEALDMAGKTVDDLEFFDIYSCFPCAVQIACNEIGVAHDDPRGLTLTGGLPYFGGPGNNYSMHGIAEAVSRARARPGAFGLVTANGWFLTKHAMGVYSTTPFEGQWRRRPPAEYQSTIDAQPHPDIVTEPQGDATIETYTVAHGREGPKYAIIIGRDAANRRFVARSEKGRNDICEALTTTEGVGRKGVVASKPGGMTNTFTLI